MSLLSREDFVNICTETILNTRKKITIGNQKSGYVKYHREIKENNYISKNIRAHLISTTEDEYMYRHDLIEHVGLGNCHELADYLLVEVGKEITRKGAKARIRIVSSLKCDHVYLEIMIRLKGEKDYSIWEVDAWDPRIIDISTRPDGSIKNHESLIYGYSANTQNSVYTDQINYNRRYTFFNAIPKPLPGSPPAGSATPEREILEKHAKMYDDYTLEESMEAGMFDTSGDVHYLQQVSSWQH
ncbi:hypothetical protein [Fluoribacter gormanii]|uniref:Uncharacterized protein n=1 Tax=Fluoribacter gormanii TaxID=464 RepID=A0A377GMY0_9GAMM|nr:hypothetical protein [Fluoribacter gormanii]KTD00219.1 hypothetical protein Lgor_3114 [Fluoribacter gormanii]SIR86193.1 hypothetical protein SAMN05421777_13124 [Fluoribacter gormanii]STO26160.1 Uncharacterised protein [Fluoribacter gormanii]